MPTMMEVENFAQIKVVGVGGGGCNAVNRMIQEKIRGVQFIAINTDAQALVQSEAPIRLRVGDGLTRGLGVGGDATKGALAANENRDEIRELLQDADMVFIAAGMGGGTGTGAAPIVAELAKEAGALSIGVVTKPFTFEGSRRRRNAEEGIAQLKEKVDTLLIIPNDRLLTICDRSVSIDAAFRTADDVLRQAIQGISELITVPGEINLDFSDVRAIMSEAGPALMAIGHGSGQTKAVDAARAAITSPLLDCSIEGAKAVLFNITGGPDLTLFEVNEAADVIAKAVDPDANIIFGMVTDLKMEGDVKITVIATGFANREMEFFPMDERIHQLTLTPSAIPEENRDNYDIPPFLRRMKARA